LLRARDRLDERLAWLGFGFGVWVRARARVRVRVRDARLARVLLEQRVHRAAALHGCGVARDQLESQTG
jgi:hypothetical protein